MSRVVILRPEPGASRTLERALAMGLDTISVPLFAIEPITWIPPNPAAFDALLVTSANAIRQGGGGLDLLRTLPVHAVGRATADAAQHAGFAIASIGEGGVADVLANLPSGLRLLHLSGEDRTAFDADQEVTTQPTYRSAIIPDTELLLAPKDIVLVHSQRAGRRLVELTGAHASVTVAAISEAAAVAVGKGWASIAVADRADDTALLELAGRLCDKPRPS